MSNFKVGDIVARKSYGCDILFKVVDIMEVDGEERLVLKGICYRIQADAPESDLILQTEDKVNEHHSRVFSVVDRKNREIWMTRNRYLSKKNFYRDTPNDANKRFSRPGKVLHIDGDSDYLNTCMDHYKKFGINVEGVYYPEKEQPAVVYKLLNEHRPDILVLTGHDGMIKGEKSYLNIENYSNSQYYVDSVKEARRYQSDLDSLVVFAGACQSMYTDIIAAGANYASSPYRVLIHALDPVYICQKVALTSIDRILEPFDVIGNTITGIKGIGGIQTRGKYRDGFPAEPYK